LLAKMAFNDHHDDAEVGADREADVESTEVAE
jgi:hypothetical protein